MLHFQKYFPHDSVFESFSSVHRNMDSRFENSNSLLELHNYLAKWSYKLNNWWCKYTRLNSQLYLERINLKLRLSIFPTGPSLVLKFTILSDSIKLYFLIIYWFHLLSSSVNAQNWLNIPFILSALLFHLLLFIERKYTIINANLKLINEKIHSFYWIDIHLQCCHVQLKFLHEALAKRMQYHNSTSFNIVECNMLNLFGHHIE